MDSKSSIQAQPLNPTFDGHAEILIFKVRALYFFGNFRPDPRWDHRQILSPYQDDLNTFMGYFGNHRNHNGTNRDSSLERFLSLSRTCFYESYSNTPRQWLYAPLNLQAPKNDKCCGLPKGVTRHGPMTPEKHAALMGEMAFLIGAKDPMMTPSPMVGWAHGAAYINEHEHEPERY